MFFLIQCTELIDILLLLYLCVPDSVYLSLIILQFVFTTFNVPDIWIKYSTKEPYRHFTTIPNRPLVTMLV